MVKIELKVILKSPFSIRSGAQQGTVAQRGLLKDREGWPYFPATALKGRLRHAVEQIASTFESKEPVLDPHEYKVRQPSDPVSIIFGTPWIPGKVIFEDLYVSGPPSIMKLKEERRRPPRTVERTSVSINRRRKVAADQRLFKTELLWPGVPLEFSGEIAGEMTKAEAGLLVAGLRMMTAMGQGKTGGLGWIEIETTVRENEEAWPAVDLLAAIREAYHA